jgi:hypothetical protein
MPYLKKLFWAYFLLLIFEGALRKWVAPQLSAPLLLVRDPIAMLILVEAHLTNKWPERWSAVTGILTAALIGLCVIQMVAVENPWIAAVYGLRSYLLPFPVAFVMGENLDAEDLRKFGVCMLWLLMPMTVLEMAQYIAPATSFLNAGAYKGAEQILYVGKHARASGTFSYVVGPVAFNVVAAAFIFYGLGKEGFAKKWLLWAASFALLLSIPVIGSRGLVYELTAVVACAGIAAMSGVTQFGKSLRIAVPALVVSILVSLLPIFSQASVSLRLRFAQAGHAEGGTGQVLESRTVAPIIGKIENTDFSSNPFGLGMGRGAAAINKLMGGASQFPAGEGEVDRALNELGPMPGLAFMLFRLILTVMIVAAAIARVRTHVEPLALLLAPSVVSGLFFGILEQPMEQGFMVLAVAFSLAALKRAPVPAIAALSPGPRLQLARYNPRPHRG